jgi:hypothetical protein
VSVHLSAQSRAKTIHGLPGLARRRHLSRPVALACGWLRKYRLIWNSLCREMRLNRFRSTAATIPGILLILPHLWLLAAATSANQQPCSVHASRSRQVLGITVPCETATRNPLFQQNALAKNTKSDQRAPAPERSQDAEGLFYTECSFPQQQIAGEDSKWFRLNMHAPRKGERSQTRAHRGTP